MGTELKLIIGEIWKQDIKPDLHWQEFLREYGQSIHEVARVDLSGVSSGIWALVYKAQAEAADRIVKTGIKYVIYTESTIKNDDGTSSEGREFEDRYGSPLGAIKLTELLPVLKEEFEKSRADYGTGQGYRRYELAIAMIEVVLDRFAFEGKERLVALTWGY